MEEDQGEAHHNSGQVWAEWSADFSMAVDSNCMATGIEAQHD